MLVIKAKQKWTIILLILMVLLFVPLAFAQKYIQSNLTIFPIKHYNQTVDHWLNPKAADYNARLLTEQYQLSRLHLLQHTYYGTDNNDQSPWSGAYVAKLLHSSPSLSYIETTTINDLAANNLDGKTKHKINYGMNFRPYSGNWFANVKQNMQLEQLNNIKYTASNRAIATANVYLRLLPTNDPFFYHHDYAGEGYPFDNLQQTAVFAGTPLYILDTTVDKKWDLVLTPNYAGWVDATTVGSVDQEFINAWQKQAYDQLVGITKTNVSILNTRGQYQFTGYVGMLFPIAKTMPQQSDTIQILIPIRNASGSTKISMAMLNKTDATILPLIATKANFAALIQQLQGRPYGWGNLNFYNDCSSEMKALFALFGIYLPRNTNNQQSAGKVVDLSRYSINKRLEYLMKHGVPLMTLIYIKGHVMLYVGNYTHKDGRQFPLSYQEMWGFKPHDLSYRSVVGMSVFLPLLEHYPESKDFISPAGFSTFKLIYLDSMPVTNSNRNSWHNLIY